MRLTAKSFVIVHVKFTVADWLDWTVTFCGVFEQVVPDGGVIAAE
jgi:hypothetical protein